MGVEADQGTEDSVPSRDGDVSVVWGSAGSQRIPAAHLAAAQRAPGGGGAFIPCQYSPRTDCPSFPCFRERSGRRIFLPDKSNRTSF